MLSLPDFREKNIVICFANDGQKVSFKNDNLIIKGEDENILLQATCHKIFALWIIGHAIVTTGLLERSKKFAFPVLMLTYGHRPYGIWNCPAEGNYVLRKKQYDYKLPEIAQHLIHNKINNQISLLKSIRNKPEELKADIDRMTGYMEQIKPEADLHALLGTEGIATRVFFNHWFNGIDWHGRKPRIKCDILNVMLDIGYTYLFYFMEAMLNLYGFDLYQGVYHRCFYQRKSLVCDLVEPFRCIIDKQVKRGYSLGQINEKDFDERKGQYFLKPDRNKDYARMLLGVILERKEEIFNYVQQYYRCFMRQKPVNEYPVFNI